MEKKYSRADIFEIIDRAIKDAMQRKNEYLRLNGYNGAGAFDNEIAALSSLYSKFKA